LLPFNAAAYSYVSDKNLSALGREEAGLCMWRKEGTLRNGETKQGKGKIFSPKREKGETPLLNLHSKGKRKRGGPQTLNPKTPLPRFADRLVGSFVVFGVSPLQTSQTHDDTQLLSY